MALPCDCITGLRLGSTTCAKKSDRTVVRRKQPLQADAVRRLLFGVLHQMLEETLIQALPDLDVEEAVSRIGQAAAIDETSTNSLFDITLNRYI